MEFKILEHAKEFVRESLKNKIYEGETTHPWRSKSEHIVIHCFRVYSIAMKIAEGEREGLSEKDILLIKLSAVLHDIGKSEVDDGHAQRGADIIKEWLQENQFIELEDIDKERLVKIISKHSDKNQVEDDLCSAIIKDADLLDEIGALSIFMASNRIDRDDPYFFNNLKNRLETFELEYCDEQMKRLNTESGKEILREKVEFIKRFIDQLEFELKGTEDLYNECKNSIL